MPDGSSGSWQSEALDEEGRAAFYKAAISQHEASLRAANETHKMAFACCAGGVLIGVFGIASALAIHLKQPLPEPPGYLVLDKQAGRIDGPIGAAEVPKLFSASVIEKALRDYIVACESYIPEIWSRVTYHECMVMSAPKEQKRRAEDIGKGGPHYPPDVFGVNGWAMPTAFPLMTLHDSGQGVFEYEVRYERTEIVSGKETRPRYTAKMVVSFHPELKMEKADRLINQTGTQMISFSTTKD
jgi:type IV secretory pathway component VirB8